MSAKAPEGRQSLAEQVKAFTRKGQAWLIDIGDVLKLIEAHEQADEQRRKETDERIARVEIVQEEIASFCNSRKKPTFDQMDAWVLALNPAMKNPSTVVLESQEKP